DNSILSIVLALAKEYPDTQVILVSKDINMRIKAAALEIKAEDYHSDQTLDDIDLLYSGSTALPEDFWETHGTKMESWIEDGHTYYKLEGPLVESWFPGQYLYIENGSDSDFEAIVRSIDNETATLELAKNYREGHHMTWGINAKNREQNFALNVLMDPEIDFVTLLGTAGTGKTLLALAAGLAQTMDDKTYKEIIMTRETVPVGEDIGFLPGTEEEKMTPWMGALIDNLELLGDQTENSDWEQNVTKTIVMNKIKIRSLNFMRGRTFLIRYLIIDEAQNLTPKQMKTLITRAGPGTKIVCIGNLSQINTPYLTATSSGLTYVVDKFKSGEHAAHITLKRGERSRLADHASEIL
ncbi:MAG: PhoH family protein, partial [Gammaproteobacteria bacterium]